MKRIFKIVGVILLVFLALLVALPFAFSGKIKDVALAEANKQLNADVYLNDFSLSFIKNFPHASISIDNFGIVGRNKFQGDTLASVGQLVAVLNVKSLFTDKYEINKVSLKDTKVNAKVLEDGKANWDIVASDSTEVETVDTSASSPFAVALKDVEIERLNVKYDDAQSKMQATINDLNLDLAGDFSQGVGSLATIENLKLDVAGLTYADNNSAMDVNLDNFTFDFSGSVSEALSKIKTQLGIAQVNFKMGNVPYLSNAKVTANVDMDADVNNNKYTFRDNKLKLNEIEANFSGFVQLIDSATTDLDITLNTPSIDFKQILSLIPAIYAKDFASVQTAGKVSLSAMAKGRMQGEILPSFDVKLNVADAMFKYPSLPSSVNDIQIDVQATNPGGVADRTVVNVPKLKFNMAGNPFEVHLILKNPVSDPDFDFAANGIIDFDKIKEVVPLDSMELHGKLNADLNAKGKLSYAEKQQYEDFNVAGTLGLNDFILKSSSLPNDVNVSTANFNFATKFVELTGLSLKIGKNDLFAKGSLQNFLPYILRDETLIGKLSVSSNYFNANDFLSSDKDAEVNATVDTTSMAVIEIPGNIDFTMDVAFKELHYDNFDLADAVGNVVVKDKTLDIKNLSTKTFGGTLNLKGQYNAQDIKNPKADMTFKVENMIISKVFSMVETAKQYAPILADAGGNFSMTFNLNSALGSDMMPILNSISAGGSLKSSDMQINGVKALDMIADKLKFADLKSPKLKDILVNFSIKDGKLITEPFKTNIAGSPMEVSGTSGLDQSLDYVASITLPNSVSSKLSSVAGGSPMKANLKLGGTYSDPKVGIDFGSTIETVKEAVKEKVTATVDKAAQKALAEAKEQQKKLLAQAEKQAESIRNEARKAGDKLVEEAQTQADNMVKKSKNPIEKAAKKKAGEALVKEARKKADKLNAEADEKANKLVSTTKASTDKTINDAQAKVDASKK